ncbi:MAG: HAD-IA family hydrolase [Patescibacteria group bacterium]
MKIKTILFDFFGVLSTPVYKTVIEKFIPASEQIEWIKKLDVLDAGDLSENELVKLISEKSGIFENEIWKAVNNAPKVNYELFDFIENNLKDKYKIGLLTNIPRSLLERLISEKLGMFDPILISSDLKLIKPSKEIFETAIQRCGCLPEEILFIDDGEKNIEIAKSLGLNGIVYKTLDYLIKEIGNFI